MLRWLGVLSAAGIVLLLVLWLACRGKQGTEIVVKYSALPPPIISGVNQPGATPTMKRLDSPAAATVTGTAVWLKRPFVDSPSIAGDGFVAEVDLDGELNVGPLKSVRRIRLEYDEYGLLINHIHKGDRLEFLFDAQGKCIGVLAAPVKVEGKEAGEAGNN